MTNLGCNRPLRCGANSFEGTTKEDSTAKNCDLLVLISKSMEEEIPMEDGQKSVVIRLRAFLAARRRLVLLGSVVAILLFVLFASNPNRSPAPQNLHPVLPDSGNFGSEVLPSAGARPSASTGKLLALPPASP